MTCNNTKRGKRESMLTLKGTVKFQWFYILVENRRVIFVARSLFRLTFILFFSQCPFGRVIYVFGYKNAPFLRQLQSEIMAVNAEALELDTLPQHVIEAALSTYKLSK